MTHALLTAVVTVLLTSLAFAQSTQPTTHRNLRYAPETAGMTDVEKEAGVLDLHLPTNRPVVATLVWLHGGGLTGGNKGEMTPLAKLLTAHGIAVVTANYRLSPANKFPAYLQDAAAAVAWTRKHIGDYGGDPKRIVLGGYSAGGYLANQIASDPKYLAAHGLSPADLRGTVTLAPQVFTHFAVRKERGAPDAEKTPLIDDAAPAYHASAAVPPVLIFVGDADIPTRFEEVSYYVALLQSKKHPDARVIAVPKRNHETLFKNAVNAGDPVGVGLIEFVRSRAAD